MDQDRIAVSLTRGNFSLGPFDLPPFRTGVSVVAGDNGAGKSCFFDFIRGYIRDQGQDVAFLPQTFTLPPYARLETACQFVADRRIHGSRSQIEAEVDRVIAVTGLQEQRTHRFRTLSGGMHRRAGICLALLGSPQLVILDEPTAGLDMRQRAELLCTVEKIARAVPVVLSSHIQEDLESTASRVVLLDHGKLVFDGTPTDFESYASPDARSRWASAYTNLTTARAAQ